MKPCLLALAVALATTLGCLAKGGKPEAAENPKFSIPHSVHVEAGLSCATCHASISSATKVGPSVHVALPSGEAAKVCIGCHDQVPTSPLRKLEEKLSFSHAGHLKLVKGDCAQCHLSLPEPGQDEAAAPPMSTCTQCHKHEMDYAQARCTPCHVDLKRYPLKPVADFKHQGDFLRKHGQLAHSNATTCANCHEQTSCAECHAATTRPVKPDVRWPEEARAGFIHRGDYVSRHSMDAKTDPSSCRRCHGTGYCQSCHNEQRVLANTGGRDPHPPGWASRSGHGAAARLDIVGCAACHDRGAKSTCVSCHKFVNPHPAGWSLRHNKSTDVASNSMCRTCHLQ